MLVHARRGPLAPLIDPDNQLAMPALSAPRRHSHRHGPEHRLQGGLGAWRFVLVLAAMSVVGACGMTLREQLLEHGSVRGMARAAERQARVERQHRQALPPPAAKAAANVQHVPLQSPSIDVD